MSYLIAGLGAATSIGSSLINRNTAIKTQQSANLQNLKLAKDAQAYDYAKWQEMNKYNTPAAQMSRLKEAGLNPNLIYGSGSVSGNTSGQSPKAVRPEIKPETGTLDPMAIMSMYSAFMTANKDKAQADLINENSKLTKIRTLNEATRGTGLNLSNKYKQNLLSTQSSLLQEDLKQKIFGTEQSRLKTDDMYLQNKMNHDLKKWNQSGNGNSFMNFLMALPFMQNITPANMGQSLKDGYKNQVNKFFKPIKK